MEFTKKNTLQLKGIAIILMLFHHCLLSPNMYKEYEVIFSSLFTEAMVNRFAAFGKQCVSIFAFLSAYGLSISYKKAVDENNKLKSWYTKKITTLYSGYWFVFVFSIIICELINGLPSKTYNADRLSIKCLYVLLDFLGIRTLFKSPGINGAWWYMTVAFMIVILVPLLKFISSRISAIPLLLLTILFPRVLGIEFLGNNSFMSFLVPIMCGVIFADNNLMAGIKNYKLPFLKNKPINKFIKLIIMTIIMYFVYKFYFYLNTELFYDIKYGIIGVYFVVFCNEFISEIPIISVILEFLGKHSMNIFYVHIFIRSHYGTDFIYSFKNFILIIIALLLSSLVISLIIEFIKELIHYNKLIEKFSSSRFFM
ncbi:MAG: acyltransferase [Clostridia bacterium]|nr:acyltransferase [Clostridia bacterium]